MRAEGAPSPNGNRGGSRILESILFDAILILAPLLYLWKTKTQAREYLGLHGTGLPRDAKNTAIVLAVLLLLAFAVAWLFAAAGALGFAALDDSWKVENVVAGMAATAPYMLLYFVAVRAFAEEVFFRGFLAKKLGIWPAALVFGISHAGYGSVAEVAGAFVLGGWLGFAYIRNNSLLPNILGHMLYNSVAIMLIMW